MIEHAEQMARTIRSARNLPDQSFPSPHGYNHSQFLGLCRVEDGVFSLTKFINYSIKASSLRNKRKTEVPEYLQTNVKFRTVYCKGIMLDE